MKTIYTIAQRTFTTFEFAKKFADKNNLDYSLISEQKIKEYVSKNNVFIGKESQEQYNSRRAN